MHDVNTRQSSRLAVGRMSAFKKVLLHYRQILIQRVENGARHFHGIARILRVCISMPTIWLESYLLCKNIYYVRKHEMDD